MYLSNYFLYFTISYGTYGSGANLSNFIPGPARGPFELVESVVHTVSSTSMLLDSTYNAMIMSVRSIFQGKLSTYTLLCT